MEIKVTDNWQALKHLAQHNQQRLLFTFGLVATENILYLTYPLEPVFIAKHDGFPPHLARLLR